MTSYPNRETVDLDGIWQFRFLEGVFLEEVKEEGEELNCVATVPGDFDVLPEYLCKRGSAVYRRSFTLAKDAPAGALLKIGGIGLRGRFRIDGREVGLVNLPWSEVALETGPLAAGTHTVSAVIDNNFSAEKMKLFLPYYDFYAFGGFHRSVALQALPEGDAFDRVQVRTVDYRTGRVSLRILMRRVATGKLAFRIRFDQAAEFQTHELALCDGVAEIELTVPGFRLWSPKTPALHMVELCIDGDSIVEEFGIREVAVGKKSLMLNGEPLYLKGFNRHESHPTVGAATTPAMMLEDLQNLRQLNCNFVRGSHYPQSREFLDLCDRMGFLVWEESLGWGNKPEQMADPEFRALQEEQTRLMVRNSINHPSVIVWGFLNEFNSSSQEGRAICEQLMNAIHEEDRSRLATFASCHAMTDICFDLVDFVAFNTYPGWIQEEYLEEPMGTIEGELEKIVRRIRTVVPADMPILVSEMGTCGLYGERDRAAGQWSEEFQAEYLEEVIRCVFGSKELCGLAIWQMNDAKSYHRMGANIRCKPLAYNLAGSFDPYRRPKLAAWTVGDLFNGD